MKEKIEKTFTIYRQNDKYNQYDRSTYRHLNIILNIERGYSNYNYELSFLTTTSNPGHWFGCEIKIQAENMEKISIITSILKKTNLLDPPNDLISIIDRLKKDGFIQTAYHEGMNKQLPINTWPTGQTWEARLENGQILSRVVSNNEYKAQRMFTKEAAKSIEGGEYGSDKWIKWLSADKPVFISCEECKLVLPDMEPFPKEEEQQAA